MPLIPYKCTSCGFEMEELFFRYEDPEEAIPCSKCFEMAPRSFVCKISFSGADQSQLDSMSRAHFTDAELRAGKRFKSAREIDNYETSKGLKRLSHGTVEFKRNQETLLDQASTMERIRSEDGNQGVADFITKSDIQSKHNWSDSRYSKWKEMSNAAQKSYDPSKHPITSPPTGGSGSSGA